MLYTCIPGPKVSILQIEEASSGHQTLTTPHASALGMPAAPGGGRRRCSPPSPPQPTTAAQGGRRVARARRDPPAHIQPGPPPPHTHPPLPPPSIPFPRGHRTGAPPGAAVTPRRAAGRAPQKPTWPAPSRRGGDTISPRAPACARVRRTARCPSRRQLPHCVPGRPGSGPGGRHSAISWSGMCIKIYATRP